MHCSWSDCAIWRPIVNFHSVLLRLRQDGALKCKTSTQVHRLIQASQHITLKKNSMLDGPALCSCMVTDTQAFILPDLDIK